MVGSFSTLEELNVQSNDIRSRGLFAVYQACIAEKLPFLCPSIKLISCRMNKADPATLRKMRPCPPFLAF